MGLAIWRSAIWRLAIKAAKNSPKTSSDKANKIFAKYAFNQI